MIGPSKKISSIKFWICTVIYILISFVVIAFTADVWFFINMLFMTGPVYLLLLIYVTIICAITKQIRYTPSLIYPILLFQTIIAIFNLGDVGYNGYDFKRGCGSRDSIRELFDLNCDKLWIESDVFRWTIFIYAVTVFIFAIDILTHIPLFRSPKK
jgi:hypothetical protein